MKDKIKTTRQIKKETRERVWIFTAIISMTVYLGWRFFFTIPDYRVYGYLSAAFGFLLAVSEALSMIEGADHFTRLGKKVLPQRPEAPEEWYPEIDVLIATHNEETDLLFKTINGCKHMDYPDQRKVHIYVCDDQNRPQVAKLAEKMKVGYFGLSDNKEAKAGNLNHALRNTKSPWVVTFDSDMIPTRSFLLETVPYIFLPRMKQMEDGSWRERSREELEPDYKIGFIQTPQSFYNPDLFQYNFFSENRIPNEQDFFFREINVGRNQANAVIYAGSNTLISRKALEEVGGIATGTITEDFETGINIQSKGYTCYAVDKALAHGLAPTDIDSLIKQRVRWGRGCISSLRRVRLLSNRHMKLRAKISYLACYFYWWTFFRRYIFIASPILFVLFQVPVLICSLRELAFIWLPAHIFYNKALNKTSGKLRSKNWSNTVDTVIFPYLILPIIQESLFISQRKFHVTKKTRGGTHESDLLLAVPHMILLAFDGAALAYALSEAVFRGNYGAVVLIYWLGLNGYHLIMAVLFMSGRRNYRAADRFIIEAPAEIIYHGRAYYGMTADLSETGLAVLCEDSVYMPRGEEEMTIRIKTERYEARFQAACVHVKKEGQRWRYGIRITDISETQKEEYFQILYDREHSLAKEMGPSVTMLDDMLLNIQERSGPLERSQRGLPRMELNCLMKTAEGDQVRLINCNYEYVLLEAEKELPEKLELPLSGSPYTLKCVKAQEKPGLYRVANWKELLFKDAFKLLPGKSEQQY